MHHIMKTNYLLVLFALLLAIPQAADAKKEERHCHTTLFGQRHHK